MGASQKKKSTNTKKSTNFKTKKKSIGTPAQKVGGQNKILPLLQTNVINSKREKIFNLEVKALKNRAQMITKLIKSKIKAVYEYIANPYLTGGHNTNIQLGNMLTWLYFDRPRHLVYHNMITCFTSMNSRSLLGLGLKFCPVPRHTKRFNTENFIRFRKNLTVKTYFSSKEDNDNEGGKTDDESDPKLYMNIGWDPLEWIIPTEVLNCLGDFETKISALFTEHKKSAITCCANRHTPSTVWRSALI